MKRRTFLQVLGGAAAFSAAPIFHAFAEPTNGADEFFVFIHASGGWDVTISLDPRNERKGLVDPATSSIMDTPALTRWKDVVLDADEKTFELVRPSGSSLVFGPAIGDLADLADRLCVINGIAMNTVSHPDGTVFSASGRHLAGGRVPASSIDTMIANEFGKEALFPLISARFPSSFVGAKLDRRAMPLLVDSIGSVGKVLTRSNTSTTIAERDAVTAMLTQEAQDLAKISEQPLMYQGMALQLESLRKMLASSLKDTFDATKLKAAQPAFNYAGTFQGGNAVNAAFAIEAFKRNIVRCVSFQLGGLDTHNGNYRDQGEIQQELFNVIATMMKVLDGTPHPTKAGAKLSDHTHVMVVSEFCRTPQMNISGGRDHYPNNSALVISPKFKRNTAFGRSDPEQLLPMDVDGGFVGGKRAVSPPDILATFLAGFGVDPRTYMRDGEVIKGLLAT